MEEDRISQFPDEILHRILSFIDTFEAVQTTILSTRWKNLWRSLPNLRFDVSLSAAANSHETKALYHRFSNRVSHSLSHRDAAAPVHNLHLSFHTQAVNDFYHSYDRDNKADGLAMECMLYAINHGVQSLRIHAPDRHILRLPAALIASKTLRELDLFCSQIHVPGRLSLPNLKTLSLDGNLFFYDDQEMDPFAGLPELEKLSLRRYHTNCHVLKAPKLRVLEIVDYSHLEEISAPLLTSFRYEGSFPFQCPKVDLPMLEQVYLDIHDISYNVYGMHQKCVGMHQKCVRMLHQFGNATTVSLTLDTLKVLGMDGGPIEQSPPFPKIKCLKVIQGQGQGRGRGRRRRHHKICTVLQRVMNYLTVGTLYSESLILEFPDGVAVVEKNSDDNSDDEDDYPL